MIQARNILPTVVKTRLKIHYKSSLTKTILNRFHAIFQTLQGLKPVEISYLIFLWLFFFIAGSLSFLSFSVFSFFSFLGCVGEANCGGTC